MSGTDLSEPLPALCLGRPRAAKTALMARHEVALAEFCPFSGWSGRDVTDVLFR